MQYVFLILTGNSAPRNCSGALESSKWRIMLLLVFAWVWCSLRLYTAWESHLQKVKKRTVLCNKTRKSEDVCLKYYFMVTCETFCCHPTDRKLEPGKKKKNWSPEWAPVILCWCWKDLKPPCHGNTGQHPCWSKVQKDLRTGKGQQASPSVWDAKIRKQITNLTQEALSPHVKDCLRLYLIFEAGSF